MKLSFALKEKKMDLRLRDKQIEDGKLNKVQLKKYLDELPDDSSLITDIQEEIKEVTPPTE